MTDDFGLKIHLKNLSVGLPPKPCRGEGARSLRPGRKFEIDAKKFIKTI